MKESARVVLVVLLGAGCGGSSGSDITSSPSAFCRAFSAHFSGAEFKCLGGLGAHSNAYDAKCGELDEKLAQHLIAFDATKAADCIATIDTLSGAACFTDPPCFAQVITGLVPDGQPCTNYMECGARSGCDRTNPRACTSRICTRDFALAGDTCGGPRDSTCVFGLTCRSATQGAPAMTCAPEPSGASCATSDECTVYLEFCGADQICHPRLPVGQSCAGETTPCALLAQCDPTTKTCVPAGTLGQACGLYGACWNAPCDADPSGPGPGTCVPYHVDGAACVDGSDCMSGLCNAGTCAPCAS